MAARTADPTAERRPHGESGSSASGLARRSNGTRQRPNRHAFGHAFMVVSRTGRASLCMIVVRCSGCDHAHRFTAKPTFTTGVRTAPCGIRFVLHATGVGRVAA